MPDDTELLLSFAERHSATAFTQFVEQRIGFVYGTALRQTAGDAHLAKDITQIVFVIASQKAFALAHHEQLAGWLYTTTCLTARRILRDARLRQTRERESVLMSAIQNEKPSNNEALREALDEALCCLAKKDREAVLLRFFDGCSFAEISATLKINEDAARMRVSRAIEKMRVALARKGVTSTAAALGAFMSAEASATAVPSGLACSVSSVILAGGAATTAAANAAVGAGGVLAFMSTTKITAIVAVIAILASAGVMTYQIRNERTAENALAAAQREHETLRKQVIEAERLARIHAAAEAASVATPTAASLANINDPIAAGEAFMAMHPDVREKLIAYNRATHAGLDYRALIDLGLDAAQRAEFIKIRGLYATAMNMPAMNGYPRMSLATSFVDDWEMGRKMTEFLGVDDMKRFAVAQALHSAANPLAMPLAQGLYYTDTPLTADQTRQLESICLAVLNEGKRGSLTLDDWDSIIEKAPSVLTQPQLEMLAKLKQRDEYRLAKQQAPKTAGAQKK